MKLESKSATARAESRPQAGIDPILDQLKKLGMDVTRENYLLLMFGEDPQEPLDAEVEASLPHFLKKK
jgi:hypothetical protein